MFPKGTESNPVFLFWSDQKEITFLTSRVMVIDLPVMSRFDIHKNFYKILMMSERILFGRYKLKRKLSGAGMSTVFLGEDLQLAKPVVVKMVSLDKQDETVNVKRFRAEASLLQSLNYPGIVNVYDSGKDSDNLFYIMEYVPGTLLSECKKLPVNKLFDIFIDVSKTIGYLHSKGIVHRDIKPSNIIVLPSIDKSGLSSKLIDFGLARFSADGRITSRGSIVGTLYYLAPELLLGNPIDTRSDIYALGVTMYKMVTGKYPFNTNNPERLASLILQNAPKCIFTHSVTVPKDFNDLISLMLMSNPSQRIQSIQEVSEILQKVRHSESSPRAVNPAVVNIPELVGREWEIKTIKDAWSKVDDQNIILLSGPFGIGKTRIMDEFSSSLLLYKLPVIRARGNSSSTPTEGSGLVQLSLDLWRLNIESGNTKDNNREIISRLSNLPREITSIDPSHLVEQYSQIFTDASRRIAIILDDIHMLDWFSVEFCLKMAQKHKHIFLLLAQNDNKGIDLVKNKLGIDVKQIPLQSLEGINLTTFLSKALGTANISRALISDVILSSKGNPLYILEFLRMQVTKENLRRTKKGIEYANTSLDNDQPICDMDLINTSLQGLSKNARNIIEFAALFNDFFTFEELENSIKQKRDLISKAMCELLQRLLITSKNIQGNVVFRFNNSFVRSTIVSRIGRAKKATLYLSIAKNLINRKFLSLNEYMRLAFYLHKAQLQDQSLSVLIYYLCESIIHRSDERNKVIQSYEETFTHDDYTFSNYIRNVIDSLFIAKNGKPIEAERILNKFIVGNNIYKYASIFLINVIHLYSGASKKGADGLILLFNDLIERNQPFNELQILTKMELGKQACFLCDYRSALDHIEKAICYGKDSSGFLFIELTKLKISVLFSMLRGNQARLIAEKLGEMAEKSGNWNEQLCNRFIISTIEFMDLSISNSRDMLSSLLIHAKHLPNLLRSIRTHNAKVNYHLGNWNGVLEEDKETKIESGFSYVSVYTVMLTYYKVMVDISRGNFQESNLESTRIHNRCKNYDSILANVYSGITLGKTQIHSGYEKDGRENLEKAWQLATRSKDTGLIITTAYHLLNTPNLSPSETILDEIEEIHENIISDDLSLRYRLLIKHNLGALHNHRTTNDRHNITQNIEMLEDVIERGKEDVILVAKTAMHLSSLYHRRMALTGSPADLKQIENNIGVAEFIWRVVEAKEELKAIDDLKRKLL